MTVVVIGNATVDLSYDVPRLPAAGETVLARAKQIDAGGKGLNQAVVARARRRRGLYCAPLGHDAPAEVILERLGTEGLEARHLWRLPVPTDESLIFVTRCGENAIVSTAAAAHALDEAAVAPVLTVLGASDLLLMQGNLTRAHGVLPREGIRRGRPDGAQSGPIAFDYNGLWPAIDIAVVNEVEPCLTGEGDPSAAADALRREVGTVVTTLGPKGAHLVDGEGERHVPAPRSRRSIPPERAMFLRRAGGGTSGSARLERCAALGGSLRLVVGDPARYRERLSERRRASCLRRQALTGPGRARW